MDILEVFCFCIPKTEDDEGDFVSDNFEGDFF